MLSHVQECMERVNNMDNTNSEAGLFREMSIASKKPALNRIKHVVLKTMQVQPGFNGYFSFSIVPTFIARKLLDVTSTVLGL